MPSRRSILKAAGASIAASAFPRPLIAQTKEKVVVSWLPIMQTFAYYVALEEGLFEEAGLEIESVRFQSPMQIIDSLVSGKADAGAPGAAAGICVIAEMKFPGTFKVFGLQGGSNKFNRINDGFIVANNTPIKEFADLGGKSLGHLPGIQWRTMSRYMIRRAGLDPDKDVKLKELTVALQVQAVFAGGVDATLSLEPVGSIAVALKDARRAITNPMESALCDPFYSGVALMTTKFIKERPAAAKRFAAVIDNASELAEIHFDKYRAILPKYTAVKDEQAAFVAQPYLRPFPPFCLYPFYRSKRSLYLKIVASTMSSKMVSRWWTFPLGFTATLRSGR
jgi:NitT/TauT family transport system substrate-binding protein